MLNRALVLDGHSPAALACTQTLGRAGVEVHVASESRDTLAWRSRFAACRLPQPPAAEARAYVGWLQALDREHSYTLIVPSTEASLFVMRALPEDDSIRVRAILPSDRALDTCLDKHRTRELAAELGIPVPDSVFIHSRDEIPPSRAFPVVLKPGRSKVLIGGKLVTLRAVVARHEGVRRTTLEGWLPWTHVEEQDHVPGSGFGLGFLYNRGRRCWHFGWRRLHELPLTGGGSTYRCSILPPAEMLRAATQLLDALQWHGVAMVEFRATAEGRFHLMEINPRLWGSLALAIGAGVSFPLGLLELAQGRMPAPQPDYRCGLHARRLPDDAEWFLQNLRADRLDPLLLTASPARALVDTLRLLVGRELWDHFTLRDPRVGLRLVGNLVAKPRAAVMGRVRRASALRTMTRRHSEATRRVARNGASTGNLLFVCQGNICRSPVAAAFARKHLPGHRIECVGLHSVEGRQTPLHVQEVAEAMGLDLAAHESRRVTARQVTEADLILLMDVENYQALVREFPEAAPKATLLGLFAPGAKRASIPDPLAATPDETRRVLEQIECSVAGLGRALATGGSVSPETRGYSRSSPT